MISLFCESRPCQNRIRVACSFAFSAMWLAAAGQQGRAQSEPGFNVEIYATSCSPNRLVTNGDFETGNLSGFSSSGINGGFAAPVEEGTCFSFNNTLGLSLNGRHAVQIRSGAATPDSIGILTSDPFTAGTAISFLALSENDDVAPVPDPVTLEVRVLDSASNVLHSEVIKTSIVTLDEIRCPGGEARDGVFSSHTIDTLSLNGQTVRLEFRQHTNIVNKGFFTLVDDIRVSDCTPTCGNAPPIRILTFDAVRGRHCGSLDWTFLSGNGFATVRNALINPANFGATGTVHRPIEFVPPVTEITETSLSNVDVVFVPQILPALTVEEISLLADFVCRGGGLFCFTNECAEWFADSFSGFVGTVGTGCAFTSNAASPVVNGPFGASSGCIAPNFHNTFATLGAKGLEFLRSSGVAGASFQHQCGKAVLICDEEWIQDGQVSGCGSGSVNANNVRLFMNAVAHIAPSCDWADQACPDCRADLVVSSVDAGGVTGDWQTLQASGTVSAQIENVGNGAAAAPFGVTFFEDQNFDGKFDAVADNILGVATVASLPAGASTTVSAAIDGSVLFRENRVYAFVDSDEQVAESSENNNLANSGVNCGSPANSDSLVDYATLNEGASIAEVSTSLVAPSQCSLCADPRDLIGGDFSSYFSGEVGNFLFGIGDPDQYAVVDLGTERALHRLGASFTDLTGDREVFDYFEVLTSEDGVSFTQQGIVGIKGVGDPLDFTLVSPVFFNVDPPVRARFVRYNFGRYSTDHGGGSRVHKVFAFGSTMPTEPNGGRDLTASFITTSCDEFFKVATVRVGNGGAAEAPAGVPVAFYDGDPTTGARLLGTSQTLFPMPPGLFEDVTFSLPDDFACDSVLFVVVDDSGAVDCPPIGPSTIATSSFDSGHDGWLLVSRGCSPGPCFGPAPANHSATGGNPGGYVWQRDPDNGAEYWIAPAAFLGEESAAYGGSFRIDIRDQGPGQRAGAPDVLIHGGGSPGYELMFNGEDTAYDNWKTYTIGLTEDGWTNTATQLPATRDEMTAVLSSLTRLEIGATYVFGLDETFALDNVVLTGSITGGSTCIAGTIVECNEDNNIHHIMPQFSFESLVDMTLDLDVEFNNTTFNRKQNALIVDARARNVGELGIDAPLLMVLQNFEDPTQGTANADGFTLRGDPYFTFVHDFLGLSSLPAGQQSPVRTLAFSNPLRENVFFDYFWLGPENHAPQFVNFPPTSAVADRAYRHTALALDPDGQPVTYALGERPFEMSIDTASGEINWTPTSGDIGLHNITLIARDGHGGEARQRYSIQVTAEPVNRPPLFTSAPITEILPGATYEYQARATDRDGDALTFSKQSGPDEMTVSAEGLVRWEFAFPGEHAIGIRVTDEFGAYADQTYLLAVGTESTNPHVPALFGTPGVIGAVGREYLYQPGASDADPDDLLTFSLPVHPSGMAINSATGRITWTPSTPQLGGHDVRLVVDDGHFGSASQAWTIEVFATLPNQPPVIDSVPTTFAIVGMPYEYDVHAVDPEGQAIAYQLVMPPVGMQIDPSTGLIAWTPDTVGPVTVAIKAIDPLSSFGSQVFQLSVIPQNEDPQIVSEPVRTAVIGATYRYDVEANDPEGQPLAFRLNDYPAGMWINPSSGLITWTPALADLGSAFPVTVQVSDSFLGFGTQSFEVLVTPDEQLPTVNISFIDGVYVNLNDQQLVAFINEQFRVCVQATDDVGVTQRELTINGAPVTLNSFGCGFYTPTTFDPLALVGTARDAADNEAAATKDLPVVDPNDQQAPEITLHAPAPESVLTSLTDVVVSISDNTPETLTWEVRLSVGSSTDYKVIGQGTGNVSQAVVAQIDPTLLSNDAYALLVVASDGVNENSFGYYVNITGEFKPGRFTTSFTDMTVPVAGIPLTVTRMYDSFDVRPGDFGPGWRLNLPGRVVDNAEDGLRIGSRVYVDRPDGKRVGFIPIAVPTNFFFPFIVNLQFIPEPGVTDTLRIAEGSTFFLSGNYLSDGFSGTLNPRNYILRTKQRIEYHIDDIEGLKSYTDANGNTITVSPDGFASSAGLGLLFVRDAQGRITRIIEPDNNPGDGLPPAEISYEYDGLTGNLVGVLDQKRNRTSLIYDQPGFPHYLTEVLDPLGRRGIRNEYDADGRLTASVDAQGNRIEFDRDIDGRQEVVRDRLGNPTVLFYDERGNVIARIDTFGNQTDYEYDDKDRLIREEDCAGRVKQFWYDADGDLLAETNCSGGVTAYTRNADGQPLTRTDARGNVTTYEYDADGNLIEETAPDGGITTHTYNPLGLRDSTTNPLGDTESMHYDSLGRMTVHVDFAGARTEYGYNAYGDRISETKYRTMPDATVEAIVTQYFYDERHMEIEVIDALGHSTRREYDDAGQLSRTIDQLGNITANVYDVLGNLREVHYPDGTAELYAYDAEGRRTSLTNRSGHATQYEYDRLGRLVKTFHPDATPEEPADDPYTEIQYDCVGRILTQWDERRNATQYDYSCSPELQLVTDALNHTTEHEFDLTGNRVRMTDALGHTTLYQYDSMNRLTRTTFHDATFSRTTYDLGGRKIADIDQDNKVTNYEHDEMGRLTAVILHNAGEDLRTSYSYDELGNQLTQTDAELRTTTFAYDKLSRRTTRILPLGQMETMTYDQAGRMATKTDFNGDTIVYEYDSVGRLIRETTPDGGFYEFAYTGTGKRTLERIVCPGEPIEDTVKLYDERDRLLLVTNPDGSSIDYDYDAAGNRTLLIATTPHISTTTGYEFDALNRLQFVYHPDGGGVSTYTYDAVGNRASLTLPNATVATYDYDSLNRLTVLTNARGDSSIISRYAYTLSPSGQRMRVDETTPSGNARLVVYTYDNVYRLTGETITDPENADLDIHYVYDNVGNRMTKTLVGPGGTSTIVYSYDANDRLLTEVETVVVAGAQDRQRAYYARAGILPPSPGNYLASRALLIATGLTLLWPLVLLFPRRPGIGKRARRCKVAAQTVAIFLLPVELLDPGAAQQLHYSGNVYAVEGDVANAGTTVTPTTYTYDDNGNTRSRSKNSLTDTYTWDFRNRLIAAANRTENTSDTTFRYDVDGIRVGKAVQNESETDFIVDKNRDYSQVCLETAGTLHDAVEAVTYVYGDDLLSMTRPENGESYYHFDGQMSTRQLSNTLTGVHATYGYDAFGVQLQRTGAIRNDYQFTGQQHDINLGFYYLRARHYVSTTGRLLSQDANEGATHDAKSLHKYVYAKANPLRYFDPSGLTSSEYGVLVGHLVVFLLCFLFGVLLANVVIGRIRELKAQIAVLMSMPPAERIKHSDLIFAVIATGIILLVFVAVLVKGILTRTPPSSIFGICAHSGRLGGLLELIHEAEFVYKLYQELTNV